MRSRDPWLILLFALPLMGGCLGYFVAESRPFVARGTWRGTISPVLLEGEDGTSHVTAARFTVTDGPPLVQEEDPTPTPIATVGRNAILVNHRKEALRWKYNTTQEVAVTVTGSWNSHDQHARWKGEPLLQPSAPRQVRDLYSVIITDRVDQSQPSTRPATTQSLSITLRAKVVSADQIDLSWTPLRGTATYRVELSEDGTEHHELLKVDAPGTSASLVGFEEARSGQNHHIRVVAVDGRGKAIGTSNVAVVRSPSR